MSLEVISGIGVINQQVAVSSGPVIQDLKLNLVGGNLDAVEQNIKQFNAIDTMASDQKLGLIGQHENNIVFVNNKGKLELKEVTPDNAKEILNEVKTQEFDLGEAAELGTDKASSYKLREAIVALSKGEVNTYEAYTYELNLPSGSDLEVFLKVGENWLPERREIHQEIIDTQMGLARELSDRLNDEHKTIYALRGNTAAGKTYNTSNNPLFAKALDGNGEPSGAINPDVCKVSLIEKDNKATNHEQTHDESSILAKIIYKQVKDQNLSMVIDKRQNKLKNTDLLVREANEGGYKVKILDVDVPLEVSLGRVLGRKPGGDAPLVRFEAVREGFEGIRMNRMDLIRKVMETPNIEYYVLMGPDKDGNSVEMCKYESGKLTWVEPYEAIMRALLNKYTVRDDIAAAKDQVIDEAFIATMRDKTPSIGGSNPNKRKDEMEANLSPYKGFTMEDALNTHSNKIEQ